MPKFEWKKPVAKPESKDNIKTDFNKGVGRSKIAPPLAAGTRYDLKEMRRRIAEQMKSLREKEWK